MQEARTVGKFLFIGEQLIFRRNRARFLHPQGPRTEADIWPGPLGTSQDAPAFFFNPFSSSTSGRLGKDD